MTAGSARPTAATRRRFAADLRNLVLADPHLNRYVKRAHDAADWLPEHNRCWYARTVLAVRRAYELTIDRAEADALDVVLRDCL